MRYAILSDIHANHEALDAILRRIPADLPIWFLGDAVGYYADCVKVVDRLTQLRDNGQLTIWLKGNHDQAAHLPAQRATAMAGIVRTIIVQTAAALGPDRLELLEGLPEMPMVVPEEPEVTVVHAAPDDPIEHYLEDVHDAWTAASHCRTPLCLVGHTHVPLKLNSRFPASLGSWKRQELFHADRQEFHYDPQELTFINPGSVGQPRDGYSDDGSPAYATFGILDTDARLVAIHRVPYDPQPTIDRTRAWLADHLSARDLGLLCDRLYRAI